MASLLDFAKRPDIAPVDQVIGKVIEDDESPPAPAPVDKRPPVDDGAWPAWQLAAAGGILALLVVAALK